MKYFNIFKRKRTEIDMPPFNEPYEKECKLAIARRKYCTDFDDNFRFLMVESRAEYYNYMGGSMRKYLYG